MVLNMADRSKRVKAVTDPFGHIEENVVVNIFRRALSVESCFLYADWKVVIRPALSR